MCIEYVNDVCVHPSVGDAAASFAVAVPPDATPAVRIPMSAATAMAVLVCGERLARLVVRNAGIWAHLRSVPFPGWIMV
ncbi:hypothetical protein GCM10009680_53020 [Streptomyces yatensis]|uniref:Enhanced intracellular survival protein domain-containing protein n=1 Tax=Streptomyces yatensis TaxID=155177 RepID=A0ABN2IIA3_9ACTN